MIRVKLTYLMYLNTHSSHQDEPFQYIQSYHKDMILYSWILDSQESTFCYLWITLPTYLKTGIWKNSSVTTWWQVIQHRKIIVTILFHITNFKNFIWCNVINQKRSSLRGLHTGRLRLRQQHHFSIVVYRRSSPIALLKTMVTILPMSQSQWLGVNDHRRFELSNFQASCWTDKT